MPALQSDPRWIEYRDARVATRAGLDAPPGAFERYRRSLPGYVTLLDERTPPPARIHMMQSLLDVAHFSLGVVLAGFRATEAEAAALTASPPMYHETIDEVQRLRALPYTQYLRTTHWHTVRREAIQRAEGRCQLCDSTELLQVHHRTYARVGTERPTDVIVLCDSCHKRHHQHIRRVAG